MLDYDGKPIPCKDDDNVKVENKQGDNLRVNIYANNGTTETYIDKETVDDLDKPLEAEGVQYERITVMLTAKVQELEKRIKVLENNK